MGFVDHERTPLVTPNLDSRKPSRMRPPMRSSIACLRCRKSKIKCENNGGSSPCDSCIKTGKECVFKMPEANPTPPKRPEPPASVRQERDGGSDRKKLKKIEDVSRTDHHRATVYAEEALAASFLTEDLWESLLDIYKLHFGPELSFLHLPTLKDKLGRKFRANQNETDPELNLVLLGVLTLTARFHPDLVKYLAHLSSNQPGNARSRPIQTQLDPMAASEYYADILAGALGSHRNTVKVASVEKVQAYLMLGLYEWSQSKPQDGALSAWMYVGTAIRMAHYLSLGLDQQPSRDGSETREGSQDHLSLMAMDREVRRRTMFSCFILDRMLSCGRERMSVIQSDDLQVQLPCSEDKFDLAMEVKTCRLSDEPKRPADDSVLSRFIQLVDIWGKISKYSSRGGRLHEDHPPWDQRSKFFQLRNEMESFERELPSTFTFSRSNYFKHENHQASSVYVLLHMLRCVCSIMLHREYIPFVPIRCEEPEGPLDNPTFTKNQAPPGFWKESAELIFKPAREIIDLVEICERKNKLPQSTIVLFAVWTAAFVGMVGFYFPKMDTEKHTLSYEDPQADPVLRQDVFRHGVVALAFRSLHRMSTWLKMASTYMAILREMDNYFVNIIKDYHNYTRQPQAGSTNLSVRQGGSGGGLEEYLPRVGKLKDFGTLRPEESGAPTDGANRSRPDGPERSASDGPDIYGADRASRAPSGSFTAINHSSHPPPLPTPTESLQSPGGYRPASLRGQSSDHYSDSWRYHGHSTQPSPSGPSSFPPTPVGISDMAAAALSQGNFPYGGDHDEFQMSLSKEESRRYWDTSDQVLFATGQFLAPENMPYPNEMALMPPDGQYGYGASSGEFTWGGYGSPAEKERRMRLGG